MTTSPNRSLQVVCLLSVIAFALSSCIKDNCKQFYSYKTYTPVYLSYDELRKQINTTGATEMVEVGKIYYKAPYIFVNEVNEGIHVIDNSDPSSPVNVAFINIPGNLDIAVKDNILYGDSYIDLVAVDISDPLHAKEIWRSQNVFDQRNYLGWTADPSMGIVTNWVERDTTIEQSCSAPNQWFWMEGDVLFASTVNSSSGGSTSAISPGIGVAGSMSRFGIESDHLYCLNSASITLFDISNALLPVDKGNVAGLWNAETLFPYGDKLFIGTTSGVSIYNNANPSAPSIMSTISHITGCDPVVVQGNYAYSTIHSGNFCGQSFNELNVIDISNAWSPYVTSVYTQYQPYGLGVDGTHLFVCDDVSGLKMYEISQDGTLTLTQQVAAGTTRDVIALSGWLLLVSVEGLYQYSYTDNKLVQLSFLPVQKP